MYVTYIDCQPTLSPFLFLFSPSPLPSSPPSPLPLSPPSLSPPPLSMQHEEDTCVPCIFDCRFSPDGSLCAAADGSGYLTLLGLGSSEPYKKVRERERRERRVGRGEWDRKSREEGVFFLWGYMHVQIPHKML